MGEQGYLDALWADVPEGAEPEAFTVRREWLLQRVRPGERVLDLGCGEGAFSAALREHGALPVAVDAAIEPLRRLQSRFPDVGDVRHAPPGAPLPSGHGEADVVWAGEVLEHVVDVGGLLGEIRRVLRPGGRLLATTPDHPRRLLLRLALSGAAFDRWFSPHADHLRFFSRRTLRAALEDAAFDDVRVRARGGRLWAEAVRP